MPQAKRAVILGAAGFIGSHLADRFLARGYKVVGVDNLITGDPRNLAHLAKNADFTFVMISPCGMGCPFLSCSTCSR